MVEKERPEVWDILEEVIREHPVLLNRAPTLHRLGIQAFEPVLVEGKAIQLHPLVCTAFNADFDGDQMAVHVPLSLEAQLEARVLMMSTNNILSPANGKPIIVPSQDIVLGLYYLSLETPEFRDAGAEGARLSPTMGEIEQALAHGSLPLHTKIRRAASQDRCDGATARPGDDLRSGWRPRRAASCMGAAPAAAPEPAVQPDQPPADEEGHLGRHRRGLPPLRPEGDVIFADRLMGLGFRQPAKAGISFGKDDMMIPAEKAELIATTTKTEVKEFEQQYLDGLITAGERYNKVVDAWSRCTEEVSPRR